MSDYRRVYISGGTYFFTVVTYQRQKLFSDNQNVEWLRQAFKTVKHKRPFEMPAVVVLPDHLHCLWSLPKGDADFSTRWQMIKTAFSRRISNGVRADGSKNIWQPRFYEHCIRDESDYDRNLDYIHFNSVKHGLVASPGEWTHSSFHRFVGKGWYSKNWGETPPIDIDGYE